MKNLPLYDIYTLTLAQDRSILKVETERGGREIDTFIEIFLTAAAVQEVDGDTTGALTKECQRQSNGCVTEKITSYLTIHVPCVQKEGHLYILHIYIYIRIYTCFNER